MAISYFTTFRELWFLATHPALWNRKPLSLIDLDPDPFAEFERWYKAAQKNLFAEFPNAMVLSTVSEGGMPEGRIVLLKGRSPQGLVFYTNKESGKGKSLKTNPHAALTFYWGAQQRQIRVQGRIEEVSDNESDAYFAKRPRGSQIGAWASRQSSVLESREELEARVADFEKKFQGLTVPRPDFWGGYRLVPDCFEFWELRLSRLHDRIRYVRAGEEWVKERLSP